MKIINDTSFNNRSLFDLVKHARISHKNVDLIHFMEDNDTFMVQTSEGLQETVGLCTSFDSTRVFIVRFCGNEFVNEKVKHQRGKLGITTVELLLHELEHVRQVSDQLNWSGEVMELKACKAEKMARG